MIAWTVIIAIAIGTFAFRSSMFVLLDGRPLPRWTGTMLTFVAPAALAALLAPMILTADNAIRPAPAPELIATAAAFAITRRTNSLGHAIAIGLPCYWILDLLLA